MIWANRSAADEGGRRKSCSGKVAEEGVRRHRLLRNYRDSTCVQVTTCKNAGVGGKKHDKSVQKECLGKTRQRLIEAARIEFGEKGIECATTRGIADRAECNEVTLFRHFESKKKLLAAVVQDTSDEFQAICASPGEMTGDLRMDLTRFATVFTESFEVCEGMARALIGEGRRQPNLEKELIGDVLDLFHRSIGSYLTAQIQEGRVRANLRESAVAELFTATLTSGVLRHSSGISEMSPANWIEETVAIFAAGIEVSSV
jgi:AcrR family transcriptional regulator